MSLKAVMFLLTLLLCQVLGTSVGQAAESKWDSIGVRAGADLFVGPTNRGHFELYEAFAGYLLPWKWGNPSGLELRIRLDGSAGLLKREGEMGFITALGPTFALRMFSGRMEFDIGEAPAYLAKHIYPGRNLGGPLQFVSHAAIGVLTAWDTVFGFRFEHISNAHLYVFNPGINIYMLDLKYRF